MRNGVAPYRLMDGRKRHFLLAVAVSCVFMAASAVFSEDPKPGVDADRRLSSAMLSHIQEVLENGNLEDFLALSIAPNPDEYEVLRNFFGDRKAAPQVWEEARSKGGDRDRSDSLPQSLAGRDRTDGYSESLRWRYGVRVPPGGRTCFRDLGLDGVYPIPVERSLEETGVSVVDGGLLFADERLREVRFGSHVAGTCSGRVESLYVVLLNGDWRVIPGSILESTMERVEEDAAPKTRGFVVDAPVPRDCRLASQWKSAGSETCALIERLLHSCGFHWVKGVQEGQSTDRRSGEDLSLDTVVSRLGERLQAISCGTGSQHGERYAHPEAAEAARLPHKILPRSRAEFERVEDRRALMVGNNDHLGEFCSIGYDRGDAVVLGRNIAQTEVYVAMRVGAGECQIQRWAVSWIRSGDDWLPI